jgi:glycosyltransferase involved in cell wall biosynthesis
MTVNTIFSPSGAPSFTRTRGAAAGRPAVSIIVPVRNAAKFIGTTLTALHNASIHDYEVIVIDDASIDNSATIAAESATRVIRVPHGVGPAKARNLGAAAARGDYLVFLDADVRVHASTIDRLVNVLIEEPGLCAVFGSYDDQPACPGLVSQFRNLLHHDIHQASHKEAASFWAGCGAIRRETFLRLGGFDESYRRPNIEDIELGYRLHAAGERILLAKEAQVTHLKSWTLWSMTKCDFGSRGVPWTRLLLQKRWLPNDLNLKYVHRVSVLCVYSSLCALLVAGGAAIWIWIAIALAGCILLAADASTARGRHYGWFAAALAPVGILAGALAWQAGGSTLVSASLMATVIAVNLPFYLRLSRRRGLAFALLAVPLHVIHYAVCGAALITGCAVHAWDGMCGGKRGVGDDHAVMPPVDAAGRGTTRRPATSDLERQVK